MGFSPRRDDTLPVRSSCHISRLQGQKRGNTAPNTVKICNFADKFAPHGRRVCTSFTKFSAFIRVYRQLFTFYFGRFQGTNNQVISILPRWGHFPTNFQQPLAAKLLMGSKKLGRCKNGTDLLYHHAKYGGDRVSRAGCRPKTVMFLVCLSVFLSRFGMTKFVTTETLSYSVIFKTVMVSLHTGRFVLCTYIQLFLWTRRIFPQGQIYTKIYYFPRFQGL